MECEAALAKEPTAAPILDSRAFVLLRLGRYDDAVQAYDKALAVNDRLAASLYGRGVIYALQGKRTLADTDIHAALAIDQDIGTRFKDYGVSVP